MNRTICDRDHIIIETIDGVHKIVGNCLYNRFDADKIVYEKRYSKPKKFSFNFFGDKPEHQPIWAVYNVKSIKNQTSQFGPDIMTQIENLKVTTE